MEMIGEGEEGEEGQEGQGEDGAADDVIEVDRPMEGEEGTAVAMEDRITTPYMTKYERARILGTRALQIRCRRSVPARSSLAAMLTKPRWHHCAA